MSGISFYLSNLFIRKIQKFKGRGLKAAEDLKQAHKYISVMALFSGNK